MVNFDKLKREKWLTSFMIIVCAFLLYMHDDAVWSKADIFLILLGAFFISHYEMLSLKIEILKEIHKVRTQKEDISS